VIYALLRGVAGLSLRWYYREIEASGTDRIPDHGPVLLVVNHPNALVDALVVGWIVRRRIRITAKSTLFVNPVGARLLTWVGVIPLRRSEDEKRSRRTLDRRRNADAFAEISEDFRRGAAVLIFPEGRTHDAPKIAPLRTGAARVALAARDFGVRGLLVVPIGLTFDQKDQLRSRVFAQVGDPIAMDEWTPAGSGSAARALTSELSTRLRRVTLNYESLGEAERTAALAATVTHLLEDGSADPAARISSLAKETVVAHRIEELRSQLEEGDPALRARGLAIAGALTRFRAKLRANGVRFEDIGISRRPGAIVRFAVREAWIVAVAGPLAVWGELNHFIPFRAARAIAMRSVESAADPAMRTIISGVAFVVLGYLAQGLAVGLLFGPVWAGAYLISLPISADINFRLQDRLRAAWSRGHAYLTFRRQSGLQPALESELTQLRAEALTFDRIAREHQSGSG